MNFFKSILSYLKTHFAGQNTQTLASEAHSAQLYLNLAAPGLVLALQEAGASDASGETLKATSEISTDLSTVSTLLTDIQDGKPVQQEIVSTLESLKSNLGAVLALAHIKDQKTVTTIENTANAVIAEVETIIGEFAAPPAA
jgi:hypothetical protein